MPADSPRIERFDDHRYLVSVGEGDELVEVRFDAASAFIERIGAQATDERQVILAATEFLLARQRADDLPDSVDLDTVAAAYPDFIDDIRGRLSQG